jgi:hypothetical protein
MRATRFVLVLSFFVSWATGASAFSLVNGDVGWDGPGLGHANLTFSVQGNTPDIKGERQLVTAALQEWANNADITFTMTTTAGLSNSLDFYFNVTTEPGGPFDGAGGTLAVGYFPDDVNANPLAGDVYLDEAETWTTNQTAAGSCAYPSPGSCDLFFVLLHEIGHALGLNHPIGDDNNAGFPAVMNPFFNGTTGFGNYSTLQTDDINGIQSIYGSTPGSVIIPEPGTAALLAGGLLIVGARRRIRAR